MAASFRTNIPVFLLDSVSHPPIHQFKSDFATLSSIHSRFYIFTNNPLQTDNRVAMSKAGAFDLASGLGGKIQKDDVLSAVDKYEKYHSDFGGVEEDRKANYTDMVNKYYDLVTSFYEYGWGESFHFAPRWKGESLRESIKRHEHFLALQLCLKPGHKKGDIHTNVFLLGTKTAIRKETFNPSFSCCRNYA